MHTHSTIEPRYPRIMARLAALPCPSCEGMRTVQKERAPLLPLRCPVGSCGAVLKVRETREDPENPQEPCVWRVLECRAPWPQDFHRVASVQWRLEGPDEQLPTQGYRGHTCEDCGATFGSVERIVRLEDARERLGVLARERMQLLRSGRAHNPLQCRHGGSPCPRLSGRPVADPWEPVRALPPSVAWHLEGR